MVFESLVADLINKYLGDFVENLDRSQLKIGIWGGNLKLQNLDLKESALDDLGLPVKIRTGHIEKLTLKIPLKNLYNESVFVSIDGLYALAVPNSAIKYNAEKEEKAKQESKQKKLLLIEEAKKAATDKGTEEEHTDSFMEKLIAHIIKNLQIQIKNIHLRYEDGHSNPYHPFSIGVSLAELLFQTTDEKCSGKETVKQIFKLVEIHSLAVYWNSSSEQYVSLSKEELLHRLGKEIAGKKNIKAYQYLMKPVTSKAHLKLNMEPKENNFSLPKVFLNVLFDGIRIELSKLQYNAVLEMLESLERMYLMSMYRKYRPDVPLHNHAKTWWHFARDCVLEETVRRRHRMFSWNDIIHHRTVMKKYKEAYTKMLSNPKKVSKNVKKDIEDCEKFLDVFSITLMRSQADVTVAKLGAKKPVKSKNLLRRFFRRLFKRRNKKSGKEVDFKKMFEQEFTAEEKAKLYKAIEYQENELIPVLPKEYVAVRLETNFRTLSLTLNDDTKAEPMILEMRLNGVNAIVEKRPADSAMKVNGKVDDITVVGSKQEDTEPEIVVSQNKEYEVDYSLLNVILETNPLDRKCDTRVSIKSRPLQIVYDAVSISNITDFFKLTKDIHLKQFSRTAYAKFEDIKRQSASGLKHAIEQHKYTEVLVDIKPSYVIIPHGGCYKKGDVNLLVLDLGNLCVSSERNSLCDGHKTLNVEYLMTRAYKKFKIQLDRVQLLYAKNGEDWNSARLAATSTQHVLQPISINLLLQKSMFDNDCRLPRFRMSGDLPLLSLSLSDMRLQEILQLIKSIPLPEVANKEVDEPTYCYDVLDVPLDVSDSEMIKTAVNVSAELAEQVKKSASPHPQNVVCRTLVDMEFEIKEVSVCLQEDTDKDEPTMIKMILKTLGSNITIRKYDMDASVYLGGIYVQHPEFNGNERGSMINMIQGPTHNEAHLMSFTFHKADSHGTEFESKFKNTEQEAVLSFTTLEVLLHQEPLLRVIKFIVHLQQILQIFSPAKDKDKKKKEKQKNERKHKQKESQRSKKEEKRLDKARTILHASAELEGFGMTFRTNDRVIATGRIKGISAGVVIQETQTVVTSELREVTVYDSNANTKYQKIVEIKDDSVLKLHLAIYKNATANENYSDMSCVDAAVNVQLGCIRVVFLMRFINDILEYLRGFQVKELKSQIQTAMDTVREASEALTERAKIAIVQLAKTSPRVAIKISLSAPIILVPLQSNSLTGLMLDLGHLDIWNSFSLQETKKEKPAVLDLIEINLNSLKIARVEMNSENEVIGQCLVLEPVTVGVSIRRNLAFKWYKEIPTVDVRCHLESIEVILSEGDFRVIKMMINENLAEGKQFNNVAGSSNITNPELNEFTDYETCDTRTTGAPAKTLTCPKHSDTSKLHNKFTFHFKINSISAKLYSGESTLNREGEHSRSAEHALGEFMIEFIEVKCKVKNDKSIAMSVILKDTTIDDKRRQNQERGIKRMVERLKDRSKNKHNMLELEVIKNSTRHTTVNANVCSIRMVVCPNFLMPLLEFFNTGQTASISATQTSNNDCKVSTSARPKRKMSITISIEEPEIILIEDQMNPASNSLLLGMRVEFRMWMTKEIEGMSTEVKKLQIASAIFNERDRQRVKILNDCDISIYSMAPCGKCHHVDVATSNLELNISPQTMRTIILTTAKLTKLKLKSNQDDGQHNNYNWKVPKDLWNAQKISDQKFWFLKKASKKESAKKEKLDESKRGEQLIIKIPNIAVNVKGGVGNRTVPLIIAETSFETQVKDWSSKLEVKSNVRLEVSFYNENLSMWESLLEPVVENGKSRKWDLELQIIKNNEKDYEDESPEDTEPLPPNEEEKEDKNSKKTVLPPPKMSINVRSSDPMEVTVTETCLEVLNHLAEAFEDAYKHVAPTEETEGILFPYVIKNTTGLPISLTLGNAFEQTQPISAMILETDTLLPLREQRQPLRNQEEPGIININQCNEKKLTFKIRGYEPEQHITIKRTEMRLYQVSCKSNPFHPSDIHVVCRTKVLVGHKLLHIRSIVQMKNNLPNAVEVFSLHGQTTKSCGVIEAGEKFNFPLFDVYTQIGYFFEPKNSGCETSKKPFHWKNLRVSCKEYITCTNNNGPDYIICLTSEVIKVYKDKTEEQTDETYLIHLSPPVVLHNFLDFPVKILIQDRAFEMNLGKDENKSLVYAEPGKTNVKVKIPEYQNLEWHGQGRLSLKLKKWTLQSESKEKKYLDLRVDCKDDMGCLVVSFYTPYLMINKTEMSLYYKNDSSNRVIEHPPNKKDMALFTTNTKISLKLADTSWSDEFKLKKSGSIKCKSESRIYEVWVTIGMSSSGLTKICTVTPIYMFRNTSDVKMWIAEATGQVNWILIRPKSCITFWPAQSVKNMTMLAMVEGSTTTPFYFNKTHTTLMRINDRVGGIHVQCQVSQSKIITTLTTYKPGMAPVLIINGTNKESVEYCQSCETSLHVLNPMDCVLYTWENAIGIQELKWIYGKVLSQKTDLIQNGTDCFVLNSTVIYWVSFLDGLQRVLLFTEDPDVVTIVQKFGQNDRFNQEINICLRSIGVSFVNDRTQKELVYLAITSSDVIWEEKRKSRYKALSAKTANLLENKYQAYVRELELGENPPKKVDIGGNLEVNFEDMKKIKLNKTEIRRSVEDGVSIQYKTSPHQLLFQAKIFRVQLDNQTNDHKFHTYLASVAPNKSVTIESVVRPFLEVSLDAIKHKHSNMLQIKICKVFVQEMSLKVDNGFLDFIEFITPSKHKIDPLVKQRIRAINKKVKEYLKVVSQEISELKTALQDKDDSKRYKKPKHIDAIHTQSDKELMEVDSDKLHGELIQETGLTKEHLHFFESLHCSPIKINFSLSLKLNEKEGSRAAHLHSKKIVRFFLRCQDVQDLVFRLGVLERNNVLYSRSQVISEIRRHYMTEVKEQKRVLIFGGNAVGNPYGLLRGGAEGVKDLFNEPIQGARQSKKDFAEGLAFGVRSLVGHTVGGAAGTVSGITGTIGNRLAELTFDDEYQKKRRAEIRNPGRLRERLFRKVKGLGKGVIEVSSGIVRQPVNGARKEGVRGFFKGIGKGLVGIVTKPTGGIADLASISFDSLKRTVQQLDEVERLRPPRRFYSDNVIRPYILFEAIGYAILQEIQLGKFAETDKYVAHVIIEDTKLKNAVLLFTDRQVIYVNKGMICGQWEVKWSHTWSDFEKKPYICDGKLEFLFKDKKKLSLSIGNSNTGICIPNLDIAKWLVSKISLAMEMKKD